MTLRSIQCASSTPCDACEGECNDDTDCRGNLKCLKRFDDEPVAGCLGNPIQARDYCYDPNAEVIPGATITSSSPEPTRAPSAVPPGTPSPTEKPTARPTRKPTPIPTINDDAEVPTLASNNAAKTLTLRNRECSAADPCGNCEGDCDTNEDCDGILQCFLRPDNTPVPGCQGVGVSGKFEFVSVQY